MEKFERQNWTRLQGCNRVERDGAKSSSCYQRPGGVFSECKSESVDAIAISKI